MKMTKILSNKYSVNFNRLHDVTSQKAVIFKDTAVMASNVTRVIHVHLLHKTPLCVLKIKLLVQKTYLHSFLIDLI